MYNPIKNQRFCKLQFQWTGWRHKRFRGNCWRCKQSKKRSKQRSKGIYSHYQHIEELVCPKYHPRRNLSDWSACHGWCAGNPRDFGRSPDGDPKGDCHRRARSGAHSEGGILHGQGRLHATGRQHLRSDRQVDPPKAQVSKVPPTPQRGMGTNILSVQGGPSSQPKQGTLSHATLPIIEFRPYMDTLSPF